MLPARGSEEHVKPKWYRIVVRGRVSKRYAAAFDGVSVRPGQGETVLVGELDQAGLYGLLDRLRDFGLELLRVEAGS